MSGPALISVILPVYNQADHIRTIVLEYLKGFERVPYPVEFLLVNNACRDESLKISRELEREHSSVRALELTQGGWGRAVRAGLEASRGDLIAYTNSARTTAQELVLTVLYAIANEDTVIKANRKIRESAKRRLGSLLYNLECRMFFDLAFWDINGTPKVFPRKYNDLIALSRNDDLIDLEFGVICREKNYPMLEVPIFSTRRFGGKSTTRLGSALHMYVGAYKMWRARRRA